MKKILFKKNHFILMPSGILYWPDEFSLIIADLHLEKSSYFAKYGSLLPPYDSFETLTKLKENLLKLKVDKIILLGDIFHDNGAYERLERKSKLILDYITNNFYTIFVFGNHDKNINIPNTKKYSYYKIKDIIFSHQPSKLGLYEIFGHYHPKAYLKFRNKKISKNCFIVTKKKICLPAFGVYTGGIDVQNKVFDEFLESKRDYYLIDEKNIFKFGSNQLQLKLK